MIEVTPYTQEQILRLLSPPEFWKTQCHAASLKVVRSGLLPNGARVARGFAPGVRGQHSWVVIGNPYAPHSTIVDPTIWGYLGAAQAHVVVSTLAASGYHPKGGGMLTALHAAPVRTGARVDLPGNLSPRATKFLRKVAPEGLDWGGWAWLANSPLGGWPSKEIITAMAHIPDLRPLIPIDVIGMLTNLNPGNLYW